MAKKQPPYKVVTPIPNGYAIKDSVFWQILIKVAIRKLQAEGSRT